MTNKSWQCYNFFHRTANAFCLVTSLISGGTPIEKNKINCKCDLLLQLTEILVSEDDTTQLRHSYATFLCKDQSKHIL